MDPHPLFHSPHLFPEMMFKKVLFLLRGNHSVAIWFSNRQHCKQRLSVEWFNAAASQFWFVTFVTEPIDWAFSPLTMSNNLCLPKLNPFHLYYYSSFAFRQCTNWDGLWTLLNVRSEPCSIFWQQPPNVRHTSEQYQSSIIISSFIHSREDNWDLHMQIVENIWWYPREVAAKTGTGSC